MNSSCVLHKKYKAVRIRADMQCAQAQAAAGALPPARQVLQKMHQEEEQVSKRNGHRYQGWLSLRLRSSPV
jgi:hypothetical protein